MKVGEELAKVANYLKSKVVDGEFEIVSWDKYKADILVDGIFFKMWICNGVNHLGFYNHEILFNNKEVPFIDFNEEEKESCWNIIQNHIEDQSRQERLDKIERLKLELKKLEESLV